MILNTAATDTVRHSLGFMSVKQTRLLAEQSIAILDPNSTLISPGVNFSPGVILWPGTILQCIDGGAISIGGAANIYPGTRIVARGGRVIIGANTEIGEEGGFTIKADSPDNHIEIGNDVRLIGGGSLTLNNYIGHGAQVIGPIRVQNCRLEDGGSYRTSDPDQRGGVLKGSGIARNITVPRGQVIQAFGIFAEDLLKQQSFFHPVKQGG